MVEPRVRMAVVVGGRVQGVGFRYYLREKAAESQLTGWVRNRLDRKLEFEIQGPQSAVQAMIEACQTGPVSARVEKVVARAIPVIEDEMRFTIEA